MVTLDQISLVYVLLRPSSTLRPRMWISSLS